MHVFHQMPVPPPRSANAVAFGNFDGVHLGHQALLRQVRAEADALGGLAIAVTFDPHPLALLRPERAPQLVDSLAGRLAQLAACGMDWSVVLSFDSAMAARPAAEFAVEFLFVGLAAKAVIAGHDTRFGHGGHGDTALLRALAAPRGIVVTVCGPVDWAGAVVSSSRVRRAVGAGEMADAAAMLGRYWALHGEVVHGDHRGRTIGFPTANVAAPAQVQPGHGVYACWLERADGRRRPAVTNCGVRPTFGVAQFQVEAHCLDFAEDLYGETVRLHFVERLRGEQRFAGLAELKAQIARDTAAARAVLGCG